MMPTPHNSPNPVLPNRRDEAWKWTDVHARLREDHAGLSVQAVPHAIMDGAEITLSSADLDTDTDSPMSALARQFGGDVLSYQQVGEAAHPLEFTFTDNGHSRVRVELADGAKLSVIERYAGQGDGFSNIDLTYKLGRGAQLSRIIIHDDPADYVRTITAHITAWSEAEIMQHALSFGVSLARIETRLAAMGAITATLNGAYLLNDKRHTDMTSYIDLAAPGSVIRQAVKGVVTDKARGVFQGKFHVRRPAQETDAEMRHDALMLSETAQIRSKPELEIYADDVECAHGNTIGQLDEQALFYMRQRGIGKTEAQALLTRAFVAGVFDDVENEGRREEMITAIDGWLAR